MPRAMLKAKLIVQEGPLAGHEIALDRLGSFTVGRSPRNDLYIEDKALSREHCRVDYDGEFFWLVDKSSHNGTIVNGRPITKCMLFNGDAIKVGHSRLTFSLPPEKEEE
jgi:pSer/pThr/pTyr-binding forkhead associated (FHA) protein